MSAPWARDLAPLVYTDVDDLSATVLLSPNTTTGILAKKYGTALGYQVKPYSQVCIASLAQAWDSTGNGVLTWTLMINGQPDPRYVNVPFVLAQPYGDTIYLPQPLWVPQMCWVDFLVTVGAASASVNFTGRIVPFYFLQDPALQKYKDKIRPVQGPRVVGTH